MSTDLSSVLENVDAFNTEDEQLLPDATVPAAEDEAAAPQTLLEQLGVDEPICLGGPTRTEVEQIKAKMSPGTQLIFHALPDGRDILWKTLNRGEWKRLKADLQRFEDENKREDFLFAKICLFPDVRDHSVIDTLPAGAVTNVMSEFYVYAGFQPVMESIVL